MPWLSWGLYSNGNWGKHNKQANGKCGNVAPGSQSLSSFHGLQCQDDILPDTLAPRIGFSGLGLYLSRPRHSSSKHAFVRLLTSLPTHSHLSLQ